MLRLLEKEHEECLKLMHSDFNLPNSPSALEIKIINLGGAGGLNVNPYRIWVGIDQHETYWRDPLDTGIHETIHYLNFLSNSDYARSANLVSKISRTSDINEPVTRYGEFMAILGLIKFRALRFPERENYFDDFMQRALHQAEHTHSTEFYLFLPAYFSFKTNPNLIKSLSIMKIKEAIPIIDEFIDKFAPSKQFKLK